MKYFLSILFSIISLSFVKAQDYALDWAYSVEGPKIHTSFFIGLDSLDNVYTSGTSHDVSAFSYWPDSSFVYEDINDTTVSSSNSGIYIRKMSSQGTPIWVRQFRRDFSNYSITVLEDMDVNMHGEVAITGYFLGTVDFDPGPDTLIISTGETKNFFVVVLDSDGNLVWARTASHPDADAWEDDCSFGHTVSISDLGSVFCGIQHNQPGFYAELGDSLGYLPPKTSTYGPDIAIIKYSESGQLEWINHYQEGEKSLFTASDLDSYNNLIIAGNIHEGYSDTLDFDLGPETAYATGFFNQRTLNDSFILKLNSDGQFIWVRGLSEGGGVDEFNRGRQSIVELQVDFENNIVFAGNAQNDPVLGPAPFDSLHFDKPSWFDRVQYIAKLKSDGELVWARGIAHTQTLREIQSLTISDQGRIFTVSPVSSSTDDYIDTENNSNIVSLQESFEGKGVLMSFSPTGSLLWYNDFNFGYAGHDSDDHFEHASSNLGLSMGNDGNLYYTTWMKYEPDFNLGLQEDYYLPEEYNGGHQYSYSMYARYTLCIDEITQETTACNNYTWPINGELYTEPGTYLHYSDNDTVFCDPVYQLDLELYDYSFEVVQEADSLVALTNAEGSVQWFACTDSILEPIPNQTGISFTPWNQGYYAAQYSTADCTYMSECFYFEPGQSLNTSQLNQGEFVLYPNPTNGLLNLVLPKGDNGGTVEIRSLLGSTIYSSRIYDEKITLQDLKFRPGVYLLLYTTADGSIIETKRFQVIR